MAAEEYWQIRGVADGCRGWLPSCCLGPLTAPAWYDLWNVADSMGCGFDLAYRSGVFPALCPALSAGARFDSWMTRQAAEVARERARVDDMA